MVTASTPRSPNSRAAAASTCWRCSTASRRSTRTAGVYQRNLPSGLRSVYAGRWGGHMSTCTPRGGVGSMPWKFDPSHLQVEFAVKHFGMMTVRGHFAEVNASGTVDPDNPHLSSLEVTINAASLKTHNEQRDNDLRSSNFLGVDQYPTITFKSTRIEPAGQDRYSMAG